MSEKPNWEAIQREFEAGGSSFRELADKHQVKFGTLYSRSRKWNQTSNIKHQTPEDQTSNTKITDIVSIHAMRSVLPSPANAVEGANLGLEALVIYLKNNKATMDLADHVKASNALSQYNKIIINAPPEEQDAEREDLSMFNEDELKIYAELQERAAKRA